MFKAFVHTFFLSIMGVACTAQNSDVNSLMEQNEQIINSNQETLQQLRDMNNTADLILQLVEERRQNEAEQIILPNTELITEEQPNH
jgi:oligoribonuclease (3'-5' exoribonuclease)